MKTSDQRKEDDLDGVMALSVECKIEKTCVSGPPIDTDTGSNASLPVALDA